MNAPKPKQEIIAKDCPNPEAIAIDTSSKRAAERVKSEKGQFTSDNFLLLDRETRIPDSFVVCVSPCFDKEEVKEFLSRPFD